MHLPSKDFHSVGPEVISDNLIYFSTKNQMDLFVHLFDCSFKQIYQGWKPYFL